MHQKNVCPFICAPSLDEVASQSELTTDFLSNIFFSFQNGQRVDSQEQRAEQTGEQLNGLGHHLQRRCLWRGCGRKVPEKCRKTDCSSKKEGTGQICRKLATFLLHVYARSCKAKPYLELQGMLIITWSLEL